MNTTIQKLAAVFGVVFILVAIVGFLAQGGMAMSIVHPDYMLAPERLCAYGRYLAHFADDDTAWKALPREVSAWWRQRGQSTIEDHDGEWQVVGAAADEAQVAFFGASTAAERSS